MACGAKPVYPDMKLYEEILLLKGYFKGKWVVENVISWYDPLIKPTNILHRHCFWTNFNLPFKRFKQCPYVLQVTKEVLSEYHGIKVPRVKNQRLLLRNCVYPPLAEYIFDCAFKIKQTKLCDACEFL